MIESFFKTPLTNVLFFSLFWAAEIFTAKLAFLGGAQVVPFSIQSFFLALIILALYILPTKLKTFKKIPFSVFLWLLLANGILLGLGGFLGNAGIQLTTAVNAGFLTQFTTVTTTIFAWLILKEKITRAKVVSLIVILLGTFLLVTKGQLIIPHLGDLLLILACIAWSFGPVLIRRVIKNTTIDPDIATILRPAAGIPVILLFVALSPLYPEQLQKVFHVNIFEVREAFFVILNAIFISLTWIFVNRTLKVASASYTALLSSVTPILVALLAMNFLHERLEMIQFVGIFLIITSSYISQYFKFHEH